MHDNVLLDKPSYLGNSIRQQPHRQCSSPITSQKHILEQNAHPAPKIYLLIYRSNSPYAGARSLLSAIRDRCVFVRGLFVIIGRAEENAKVLEIVILFFEKKIPAPDVYQESFSNLLLMLCKPITSKTPT
jgi:hypothetical protein